MESTHSQSTTDAGKVEKLAPLRTANLGILKQKYDAVQLLARKADEIVKDVVKQYAEPLDDFVATVEAVLRELKEGERKQLTHAQLQRMVLRLPILMYRLVDGVDMAAIESDVAKAAHKLVYAQLLADSAGAGKVVDRQSAAELRSADEATIVDLARHVHSRLRGRMEVGNALFDAVRKVISSHDIERQVFRGDKNG